MKIKTIKKSKYWILFGNQPKTNTTNSLKTKKHDICLWIDLDDEDTKKLINKIQQITIKLKK